MTTILDAILKIRKCSMMTRWHHLDSSKARSAEHESVKKKTTLDLTSRSKWFSAGLYSFVVYLYVNGSGSVTSIGEERAYLSAVDYL